MKRIVSKLLLEKERYLLRLQSYKLPDPDNKKFLTFKPEPKKSLFSLSP